MIDVLSYILGKESNGGGGSSVTVEPLNVTENDTYIAPSGKAYSPVAVNVPTGGIKIADGTFTGNGSNIYQDLKRYKIML